MICQDPKLRQQHDTIETELNENGTPRQRMVKFVRQYLPLITKVSMCVLKTGFGVFEDLYKTHVARIELEDAPVLSDAKPPRLCIKSVLPVKIEDLPEFWRKQFKEGGEKISKMMDKTPDVGGIYGLMAMVVYEPPNIGKAPVRSYNLAVNRISVYKEFNEKYGSNLSKQLQQRALISEVIKYKNTINEMAMGKVKGIKKSFVD